MACYEARSGTTEAHREADLAERLRALKSATEEARLKAGGQPLDIVLCADLNRHHVLWGGHAARMDIGRRNEGEQIIDYMQEAGLHSLLPTGTTTWEHQTLDRASTVDVVLGSNDVRERLQYCRVHSTDYGSDHRPIALEVELEPVREGLKRGRRLYKDADWDKIRSEISSRLGDGRYMKRITDTNTFDRAAEIFVSSVNSILEENVPRAKESPYAKRWWTRELTQLRADFTRKRNRVTTMRRRGDDTTMMREMVHQARRLYLDEVDIQKRQHWREFLENPENVWKVASYARPTRVAMDVPELSTGGQTYITDEEKAMILMATFFPTPTAPEEGQETTDNGNHRNPSLAWPFLRKHEVEQAIFRSNPDKAPGPDEISFRVWRELWPVVGDHLFWLYTTSLDLGHTPITWKTARIVTLRKPGKADYTAPKAFRPISLLPTISKGLEAVVAARLSYMAEEHRLLPANHFGARPRRSAEQALNVLVERTYQAWRSGKILTLVSFDVKGAFNGVHSDVLERRLAARRVPEQMVRWIRDFCSCRYASVIVGGYESEAREIEYAGIPQGSPLSPLLYIFYNADLVERRIDSRGGALGFVDDFNVWVVGQDEEQNTTVVRETILPHVEQWAKQSGATFEADKTSFIHFTRRACRNNARAITFGGKSILPQDSVKVLGVTLDQKLAMDEHISRVVTKGTQACLSLQAVKGVRPAQMRQLYRSCVLPIIDYAASTWYGPGKHGVVRLANALDNVQRLGARMILRAWKRVALPVLEAEACLETTVRRLQRKVAAHTVKLISLPCSNPARKAIPDTLNVSRFLSPLSATIAAHRSRLRPKGLGVPASDPAWIHAPWIDHSYRAAVWERERAIQVTENIARARVLGLYVDASVGKRLASIAVVKRLGIFKRVIRKDSIGWASTCGVLSAELAAIAAALAYAQDHLKPQQQLVVFSDSQHALRAIQAGNSARIGRALLAKIAQSTTSLCRAGMDLRFRWSPGHSGIIGNKEADEAARTESDREGKPTAPILERVREVSGVVRLINEDRSKDQTALDTTSMPGRYTWKMDQALPGKHTLQL